MHLGGKVRETLERDDAVIVLHGGGTRAVAFGIHGATAPVMLTASAALLRAWLLAIAFLGVGIVNAAGSAAIRSDFVRWGYQSCWTLVTGGLEVLVAALVAYPAARTTGLVLGAAICVAAVATAIRYKDDGHVPPGVLPAGLPALDLAGAAAVLARD